MFINQIIINGFRCYESVDICFDEKINVFFGENGSGKTSILEAINLLSTGKSFRSHKTKTLINHLKNEFVLHTKFSSASLETEHNLGISFHKPSKKKIKLNQQIIESQSKVAHLLPVISIDPDSYLFIDKGPQFRRSFLDWLVFHVKHEYLDVWKKSSRCHKQLNVLYKNQSLNQLNHWEERYIVYTKQLNQLRKSVFVLLKEKVEQKVKQYIPEIKKLKLNFFQGWSHDVELGDLLSKDKDKNLRYGGLSSGAHKMDLRSVLDSVSAQDVLSRGQKKMLSILFYFSFIELLEELIEVNPIVCIDDLDAELDQLKTDLICHFIKNSQNQFFISTINKNKVESVFSDVGLFHVKHAKVEKIN